MVMQSGGDGEGEKSWYLEVLHPPRWLLGSQSSARSLDQAVPMPLTKPAHGRI
jgi:hypothetical protein